ncbi:MAG TPA: hypothetical protein DD733_04605 [Clostridiales bacterium]|nr:hypothetical protein [Clostridiales bacterium]
MNKNNILNKRKMAKGITGLLLCFALIISVSIPFVSAEVSYDEKRPAYSKGDLNGDGNITAADYMIIKRIFLGTYRPNIKQSYAADTNSDGEITAVDYMVLKRYFFKTYYFSPEVMKEQIPPTDEQFDKIKEDYAEYIKLKVGAEHFSSLTKEDIVIDEYCGPYNGCYALFICHRETMFLTVITTEIIAGYKFVYSNSQTFMIYKDSEFYNVKTAFDNGLISKEDVYDLSWYA